MSNLDHLEALKIKHRELDQKCSQGYTDYLDDVSLNKMKMEKAQVKAHIQKIEQDLEKGIV
jgi:hypothetical protein